MEANFDFEQKKRNNNKKKGKEKEETDQRRINLLLTSGITFVYLF